MRVISAVSCLEWTVARNWCRNEEAIEIAKGRAPAQFYQIKCQQPNDSGRKVALAKALHRKTISDNECLVWIQSTSVYPSSGHIPMLLRIRQAFGEMRDIEEFPGYIVSPSEQEDGLSLAILSLEFFWDCIVLAAEGGSGYMISHDGAFTVMSSSEERFSPIAETFGKGKWGTVVARHEPPKLD